MTAGRPSSLKYMAGGVAVAEIDADADVLAIPALPRSWQLRVSGVPGLQ